MRASWCQSKPFSKGQVWESVLWTLDSERARWRVSVGRNGRYNLRLKLLVTMSSPVITSLLSTCATVHRYMVRGGSQTVCRTSLAITEALSFCLLLSKKTFRTDKSSWVHSKSMNRLEATSCKLVMTMLSREKQHESMAWLLKRAFIRKSCVLPHQDSFPSRHESGLDSDGLLICATLKESCHCWRVQALQRIGQATCKTFVASWTKVRQQIIPEHSWKQSSNLNSRAQVEEVVI
jgi:hypothetical protein